VQKQHSKQIVLSLFLIILYLLQIFKAQAKNFSNLQKNIPHAATFHLI